MKAKVNDFLDLFPDFHAIGPSAQIVYLVHFHAQEEHRESANRVDLERLFRLAGVALPENFPQLLAYLCKKGGKLLNEDGEYSLRREVRKKIEDEVRVLRGQGAPPRVDGGSPFDFAGRVFTDVKVSALLQEVKRCYGQECWNASGLLIRIIIERTLDSVDAGVKAKTGLRDKTNACRGIASLSKSVKESLDGLHSAKIVGDIAAHHSRILLDKNDVDLVLTAFRVLIKESTAI